MVTLDAYVTHMSRRVKSLSRAYYPIPALVQRLSTLLFEPLLLLDYKTV
jgi:hypothetical protein